MARLSPQKFIDAVDMGLSAVTGAAQRTSKGILCAGYNVLNLQINYTYNAGTRIDVVVECTHDDPKSSAAVWGNMQAETVAAGVATLNDYEQRKAVAAASDIYNVNIGPLGCNGIRIKVTVVTGGASDVFTVTGMLNNSAA